ncbi:MULTISPECIES: hypothetical protein [unclassified Fibrobacter]|uniref:hypothetical protein n=1 Tax=unclassified Fibrobacter TaxID=2634177 RepID=UPI000D6A994E|nr:MULTISPECIES: hypothetical protein [unclassified Fibrobacter]PWJ63737.1 hypothetical protein BGX12_11756 [Fibrobacter sp. UWR4]PZW69125.1 hypothetical protein C8E88_101657 [Fibrobacter sp. UWR1]
MKKTISLFSTFIFAFLVLILLVQPKAYAYDGDMDVYREFKEDLALARDTYISSLNMAMDEKEVSNPSWNDIEFEAPDMKYCTLKELPGGFKIKGAHGAYKVEVDIKFVPGREDMRYQVKHSKGSNGPGKEIVGEVFR